MDFLFSQDFPTFTTPPPADQQTETSETLLVGLEVEVPDSLRLDDVLPQNAPHDFRSIEPQRNSSDDLFGDFSFGANDEFGFADNMLDVALPLAISSDTNSSPVMNAVGSSVAGPEPQLDLLTPEAPATQAVSSPTKEKRTSEGVEVSENQNTVSPEEEDMLLAAALLAFEQEDDAGVAGVITDSGTSGVQADDDWEDDAMRSLFFED